jgi:exodeoxyribonuclease X
MNQNLLFLDTETTGRENARLIQLAYKKQGDENVFVEYYKPPIPIEIEAMVVHHITEKKVANAPIFQTSAAFKTLQNVLPEAILVAHNAKFDIGILETEGLSVPRHICTYKIAQTMYDYPMYKMQYLRYLWSIENDEATAHDAEGDVIILEKVFEHMAEEYAATHNLSKSETIEAFVKISENPILLKKMNFGKYVGKTFAEVKMIDPSYFQWLATLKDKEEDFLYTMEYYAKNN